MRHWRVNPTRRVRTMARLTQAVGKSRNVAGRLRDAGIPFCRQGASVPQPKRMLRSAYAERLFSDMSPRDAGKQVAWTIMNTPKLLAKLQSLGYEPNKVGYTPEMVRVLDAYFTKNKYRFRKE